MTRNLASIHSAWSNDSDWLTFMRRAMFYRHLYLTGRLNEGA